MYNFGLPQNLSCPAISSGNWFQDPPWGPKPIGVQVPYIEWCRSGACSRPLASADSQARRVQVFSEDPACTWPARVSAALFLGQLHPWHSFTGPPGDPVLSVGGNAVKLLCSEAEVGFTRDAESELRGGSAGATRAVRREDVAQGWKSLKSARLDLLFASRPGGEVRDKGEDHPRPLSGSQGGTEKARRGGVNTQGSRATTREESRCKW